MYNIGPLWICPGALGHNGGTYCSKILVHEYSPISKDDLQSDEEEDYEETLREYEDSCYKWNWMIEYSGKRYTIMIISEIDERKIVSDDTDVDLKDNKLDDYNAISIIADHETGKYTVKNVNGNNFCVGCASK